MYNSSLHFSGTMFTKFLALNNHLLIPLKGATGSSSICKVVSVNGFCWSQESTPIGVYKWAIPVDVLPDGQFVQ